MITEANVGGGPKKPYDDDDCDHEFDEDEDSLEWVCSLCGEREPMDLGKLIR